ncbi:acyl carrier protein [Nostoc commune]|uniref:acyl carrier protein n=1 Tax=Nostoc commune TaxID=1178 RepID=UPI0018C4A5B7|nr:phosphopantetheine-binding protein [Nostoc commune]MBG1259149.1 acyl carrier protein [Nostoc commune BAE]
MIDKIKGILEDVKGIPGFSKELSDSTDIIEDVKLDSLEMINFMLNIETELKVEIDFEQLEFSYFKSIKTFSEFLSKMKRLK